MSLAFHAADMLFWIDLLRKILVAPFGERITSFLVLPFAEVLAVDVLGQL